MEFTRKRGRVEGPSHQIVFQDAPIGVVRADDDGVIIEANARYAEILGMTAEELVGRSFRDFTPAEDLPMDLEALALMKRGETSTATHEKRYVRKDGRNIWVRRHISRVRSGFIVLAEDIDAKRKADALRSAIADASRVLAGALVERDVVEAAPRVLVPAVADLCTVALFDRQGGWATAAEAVRDEQMAQGLAELRKEPPPHEVATPLVSVLLDRKSQYIDDFVEFAEERLPADHPYLTRLRNLDIRAMFLLPLVARGRSLGALTISRTNRDGWSTEERAVLAELAQRIALALDGARLFEQARTLTENVPDFVFLTDANGEVEYQNRRLLEYFGLDATAAKRRWVEVIHPDDWARVAPRWSEALEKGTAVELEMRFRRASDVSYRWFLARVNPLRDAAGRIDGWLGTATDIDDLKRQKDVSETLARMSLLLTQEHDRDRLLQSITDEATKLVGAQFGAFFFNAVDARGEAYLLYTLSGAPREAFSRFGMPRNTPLFAPTFAGECVVRIDDVKADPRYGKMGPHRGMPAGHLPVTSYLAVPVKTASGKVLGGLFFGHGEKGRFTDDHERLVVGIASHAAVALENAHLVEALREADRRKDEFLAMLAHELRNPLAPILTTVQLMKLRSPDVASRERETVERQARHLMRLVDDLLDVSRITRGKVTLHRESCDVSAIVQRGIETARPAVDRQRHALDVSLPDEPVFVDGDPIRLAQVVSNLVTNAAKYTPPTGKVAIDVRKDGASAVITVTDSGVGIPREALARIFDLFVQIDTNQARAGGGLGIGLTLVKTMVELHGGTVTAESDGPGKGARFTVRLPAVEARKGAERTEAELPHVAPSRILVIDDNVDAARTLAEALTLTGSETRVVHEGHSGVELARSWKPEVMLVDIGLPELDGYEVARAVRSDPAISKVLLVAVTGYHQDRDRARALAAGFDAHFGKPVDLDVLRSFLSRAVRRGA